MLSVQNPADCTRARAEITREAIWVSVSPQVTTATTPEAWISSAGR
ncbi:unannotated protein [freshwater metagenome]|uniref:Unannotated protein n=1 Tax=freshwater metagenome TaxID=449393 RepID=A0A6J7G241_9ZZZZ